MHHLYSFSLLAFLFFSYNILMGQTGTVSGTIKDKESSEGLIGASVIIKGTTTGTSSNTDGQYSLSLEKGSYTLVFSYLGYQNQEVSVQIAAGEQKELNIQLTEEGTFLETTVVSASRFERNIGEETVSLDVIKPSFLANQNINDVAGAIGKNSGVVILDGQINIRGGSGYSYGAGARVLILLDDIPVLQADAGSPPWSSIPMENIGQIEIIKGAASALYGSSAMNGVVNIRTAYATSEPVTKFSLYTTTYDNFRKELDEDGNEVKKDWWNFPQISIGSLVKDPAERWRRPYEHGFIFGHRQKFGKFDLVLGAQGKTSQGWRYGSYDNYARFSAQTRYRINDKMNVGINTFLVGGNSGQFFLWNGFQGAQKYIPLSLAGEPTNTNSLRISVDPFFNYSDEKGNRHKVLGRWFKVDNNSINDQGQFSDYFYGEYQYQKHMEAIGLTLSGGMVGGYVKVDAPLYGDTTLSGRNVALYAQADKRFFDRLNVSLGLRVENNKQTNTDSETKPVFRLGANYQAAEYTFIRASAGQGYRFPTLAEKFIETSLGTSIQIAPNPDLISETGLSAEIGIKQGIKIGGFAAYMDVSAFYTRYRDMMEFNPIIVSTSPLVVGFQSQNVGNTQIFGVETSLTGEGKLFNKFPTTLLLGYTYINPKYINFDPETDGRGGIAEDINGQPYNILKYRFRHTFTSQWDVNFNSFTFGVSGQFFSAMESGDRIFTVFIPGITEYRDSKLRDGWETKKPQRWYKGDFLLDLRAGYSFKVNENKYKVSFLVKNITNHEYALRPAIMEAPRSYTLRFDVEF